MPHYRFAGDAPALVPDLHRVLQPGETFESELIFSPAIAELVEAAVPVASEPEEEA